MTEALKPSEVLSRAADLIEPEGKWAQGHGALSATGDFVSAKSPSASCWCLHGAMLAVNPFDRDYGAEVGAETFVCRVLGVEYFTDAYDWNDEPGRTQAEVVAALRNASELAKASGQ